MEPELLPAHDSAPQSNRPKRADAQRNSARIIAAASEVFGERGVDASIEEIAQRSGVGIGSIYRNFGNKDGLLGEVYASRIHEFLAATDAAAAESDPRAAFEQYLMTTAHFFTENRLLISLNQRLNVDPEFSLETCRQRVAGGEVIFLRARDAGIIHDYMAFSDVDLLLRALSRYASHLEAAQTGSWQRTLELIRILCYVEPAAAPHSPAVTTANYTRLILASTGCLDPSEGQTFTPRRAPKVAAE